MPINNVVQHPALVGPRDVRLTLRGLYAAAAISAGAYTLGSLVCARMEQINSRRVYFSGLGAAQCFVRQRGVLYAGPFQGDFLAYIGALQDLQFRVGIMNGLEEPFDFSPAAHRRHFTLSPVLKFGRHYGMDTNIHYALPEMIAEDYFSASKAVAAEMTTGLSPVDVE